LIERQTERQIDRYRQEGRQIEKETDSQIDRQTSSSAQAVAKIKTRILRFFFLLPSSSIPFLN